MTRERRVELLRSLRRLVMDVSPPSRPPCDTVQYEAIPRGVGAHSRRLRPDNVPVPTCVSIKAHSRLTPRKPFKEQTDPISLEFFPRKIALSSGLIAAPEPPFVLPPSVVCAPVPRYSEQKSVMARDVRGV